ncbi:WbqC family protein [Moheibacter sediminis]|uniref:WbqC-like protein family protein n=1 Tax=Moheibacter sediminis TaxID=1434700 RepID=A0A1W1YX40_9FLAO|nr:WbqC family protein [Moheibacter sediminis]SMC40696.1 WbqC-like protein family protein [Moheibacter sediminis]
MKIAIMQPYFMPYIGYFQLINAVDKFIIYDDVNYIKQGWINRNNILLNNKSHLFSVPLKDASSFKKINEIEINEILFPKWKDKFFKTLEVYKKAPFYESVRCILEKILISDQGKISDLIYYSLVEITKYIGIQTIIEKSSYIYKNSELQRAERLIDICKTEKANIYINPLGGQELYDKKYFSDYDIELYFIKTKAIQYPQFGDNFVPWLSIIDVMMFNTPEQINEMLNRFELI